MNVDAPRPEWTFWLSLLLFVPALLLFSRFAFRAREENQVAKTQLTTAGTIVLCSRSGKSGYTCEYVFPVDQGEFAGKSRWDDDLPDGEPVTVYYNPDNPKISSLQDFAKESRRNWLIFFGFMALAGGNIGALFYKRHRAKRP